MGPGSSSVKHLPLIHLVCTAVVLHYWSKTCAPAIQNTCYHIHLSQARAGTVDRHRRNMSGAGPSPKYDEWKNTDA